MKLPYINAEPYDENDDTSIQYMEVESTNMFSGLDIPQQYNQVLRSAAGYYIDSLYYDEEMQGYYPYDKDSGCYWRTREEAEKALISGVYPPYIW
jgi:hypothetical protein